MSKPAAVSALGSWQPTVGEGRDRQGSGKPKVIQVLEVWPTLTNSIFLSLQIPYYEIEMLKSRLELVEYLQRKLFSQNAGIHW